MGFRVQYTHILNQIQLWLCVHMSLYVLSDLFVHTCTDNCIDTCVYIYIHICMCVCVYRHMHRERHRDEDFLKGPARDPYTA